MSGAIWRELDRTERDRALPAIGAWSFDTDVALPSTDGGAALLATYPQVFAPGGEARSFGGFDGDRLVCHAALRAVTVVGSGGRFQAGLIGSVATDPAARGQGLASGLLLDVERAAIAAGLDALILWSDRWDFYGRLGFTPAGRQMEFSFRNDPAADTTGVRQAVPSDLPALTRLHEAKPYRVERTEEEMALLCFGTRTTVSVLEREGEVIAYGCLGKGADFHGWWHEVGGPDDAVADLLPGASAGLDAPGFCAAVPVQRLPLLRRLRPLLLEVREGVAALRKVLPGPRSEAASADFYVDGLDSI